MEYYSFVETFSVKSWAQSLFCNVLDIPGEYDLLSSKSNKTKEELLESSRTVECLIPLNLVLSTLSAGKAFFPNTRFQVIGVLVVDNISFYS